MLTSNTLCSSDRADFMETKDFISRAQAHKHLTMGAMELMHQLGSEPCKKIKELLSQQEQHETSSFAAASENSVKNKSIHFRYFQKHSTQSWR